MCEYELSLDTYVVNLISLLHISAFSTVGHLTRFELQEYAIVTRLLAGSFSEGDRYTKALEKRRLKEKYFKSLEKISCAQLEKAFLCASTARADRYKLELALIVEGVITAPDNNVGIDEDTLAIVDDLELFFSYPWAKGGYRRLLKGFRGQIWAYEAMLELGERFGERLVNAHPNFCARPPPNNRSSVHTMRSSGTYRPSSAILDDHARRVVGPQFHEAAPASGRDDGSAAGDGHDNESGVGAEDVNTSASDGHQTPEGNDDDGSKPADSGESGRDPSSETGGSECEDRVDASGRQSGALPTPVVAPYLWGSGYAWWSDFDEGRRGGHVV
ncbi:Hypothetical predicted protein [Olea europaea subsp. europaea]|uniref:DUF1985 domain-containing protein n=1 Tax=Olea europaea subsp. europaea TaxID=158383 RepID=A0A8S0TPM2_OLEEU|nr:Hypothetical predicted protein [Olea europaea subsp. europaea]